MAWYDSLFGGGTGDTGPTADNSIMSQIGSGLLNGAGGIIKNVMTPQGQSALGKGLGAVAQADATNRGAKLAAMMASDNGQLQQQQQRMNDLATLPKQLQVASYLSSGGYTPKTNISASGATIPHFDLGMAPISQDVQNSAKTLYSQLNNRLNTPPTYQNYSSVMNPSGTETALNWMSPILSASGASGQAATDPYAQLMAQMLKNAQGHGASPASGAPAQASPLGIDVLRQGIQIPNTPQPIALPQGNQ